MGDYKKVSFVENICLDIQKRREPRSLPYSLSEQVNLDHLTHSLFFRVRIFIPQSVSPPGSSPEVIRALPRFFARVFARLPVARRLRFAPLCELQFPPLIFSASFVFIDFSKTGDISKIEVR